MKNTIDDVIINPLRTLDEIGDLHPSEYAKHLEEIREVAQLMIREEEQKPHSRVNCSELPELIEKMYERGYQIFVARKGEAAVGYALGIVLQTKKNRKEYLSLGNFVVETENREHIQVLLGKKEIAYAKTQRCSSRYTTFPINDKKSFAREQTLGSRISDSPLDPVRRIAIKKFRYAQNK